MSQLKYSQFIGNRQNMSKSTKEMLNRRFDMKDMGRRKCNIRNENY